MMINGDFFHKCFVCRAWKICSDPERGNQLADRITWCPYEHKEIIEEINNGS
jgi:hypothetical protein